MTIFVKNKHTLLIDGFKFRCCVGKFGVSKNKVEGDYKTPMGFFEVENLYYRNDRIKKPSTKLKCIEIKKEMGWCNDINYPGKYNKLFKIKNKIGHEKLKRRDYKYNLLIPIKYNFKNPIVGLGSCIFIHLTKNYKPTAGCIALKENDFLIMLRIIKRSSKIKIY